MDHYDQFRRYPGYISNAGMSGLHADSIRKAIGTHQLLSDVFISCKQGEIIGLLGRNGTGKSTLLKIIFAALDAENKYVAIDDRKINSLFEGRKLIHYLPQDNFLPDHIRIKRIISCFCSKENAALLSGDNFIQPFLEMKINQLSAGEKRIVEVMMMLYSEAPYLLFDEPFNGISPLHIDMLKQLIQKHAASKGIIITDHSYEHVLDIAGSVILLDNGNTKVITAHQHLVELGYLPPTAARHGQFLSEKE